MSSFYFYWINLEENDKFNLHLLCGSNTVWCRKELANHSIVKLLNRNQEITPAFCTEGENFISGSRRTFLNFP